MRINAVTRRILPAISAFHSYSTTTTTALAMKPQVVSVTPVASTKWLALETLNWTDEEGKPRQWDSATRTTKQKDDNNVNSSPSSADAVAIIPLLRHKDGRAGTVETLLVEQYRPPVRQTTVEFPAGLIDKGESIENAALRELREETGYIGEKCKIPPQISRQTCMSPGLCDETIHVVVVEVDLDNPYNQGTPKPDLDHGEFVTVKRVPLNEGLQQVLDEGEGMPIMGLYLFAVGYALGAESRESSDD